MKPTGRLSPSNGKTPQNNRSNVRQEVIQHKKATTGIKNDIMSAMDKQRVMKDELQVLKDENTALKEKIARQAKKLLESEEKNIETENIRKQLFSISEEMSHVMEENDSLINNIQEKDNQILELSKNVEHLATVSEEYRLKAENLSAELDMIRERGSNTSVDDAVDKTSFVELLEGVLSVEQNLFPQYSRVVDIEQVHSALEHIKSGQVTLESSPSVADAFRGLECAFLRFVRGVSLFDWSAVGVVNCMREQSGLEPLGPSAEDWEAEWDSEILRNKIREVMSYLHQWQEYGENLQEELALVQNESKMKSNNSLLLSSQNLHDVQPSSSDTANQISQLISSIIASNLNNNTTHEQKLTPAQNSNNPFNAFLSNSNNKNDSNINSNNALAALANAFAKNSLTSHLFAQNNNLLNTNTKGIMNNDLFNSPQSHAPPPTGRRIELNSLLEIKFAIEDALHAVKDLKSNSQELKNTDVLSVLGGDRIKTSSILSSKKSLKRHESTEFEMSSSSTLEFNSTTDQAFGKQKLNSSSSSGLHFDSSSSGSSNKKVIHHQQQQQPLMRKTLKEMTSINAKNAVSNTEVLFSTLDSMEIVLERHRIRIVELLRSVSEGQTPDNQLDDPYKDFINSNNEIDLGQFKSPSRRNNVSLGQAQTQQKELERELEILELEVSELRRLELQWAGEKEASQTIIRDQTIKLTELSGKVKSQEARILALQGLEEGEAGRLKRELVVVENRLIAAESERDTMKHQLENVRCELTVAYETLDANEIEMQKQSAECAKIGSLKEKITLLEEENRELESEISTAEEEAETLRSVIKELETQISAIADAAKRVQVENERSRRDWTLSEEMLQKELLKVRESLCDKDKEMSEFKLTCETNFYETLKLQTDSLEASFEGERQTLRGATLKAQQELTFLLNRIRSKDDQLKKLQSELETTTSNVRKLEIENRKLDDRKSELEWSEVALKEFEATVEAQSKEIRSIKAELSAKDAEVQREVLIRNTNAETSGNSNIAFEVDLQSLLESIRTDNSVLTQNEVIALHNALLSNSTSSKTSQLSVRASLIALCQMRAVLDRQLTDTERVIRNLACLTKQDIKTSSISRLVCLVLDSVSLSLNQNHSLDGKNTTFNSEGCFALAAAVAKSACQSTLGTTGGVIGFLVDALDEAKREARSRESFLNDEIVELRRKANALSYSQNVFQNTGKITEQSHSTTTSSSFNKTGVTESTKWFVDENLTVTKNDSESPLKSFSHTMSCVLCSSQISAKDLEKIDKSWKTEVKSLISRSLGTNMSDSEVCANCVLAFKGSDSNQPKSSSITTTSSRDANTAVPHPSEVMRSALIESVKYTSVASRQ